MTKKPNRTAAASLLLRCGPEEKALVERAVAKLQEGLPAGAKMSTNGFILEAALERARKVLGKG